MMADPSYEELVDLVNSVEPTTERLMTELEMEGHGMYLHDADRWEWLLLTGNDAETLLDIYRRCQLDSMVKR